MQFRYLKVPFLIGMSPIIMLGSTVFAETNSTRTNPTGSSTSTAMAERLAERKNTLKLQLSTDKTQKITKNCVAAQNILKNIAAKDKVAAEKRQEVYSDISTRLTTVMRRLQLQKVDISSLKNNQKQFDTAINQYITDATTYKTAAEDIVAMDCSTDPTAFEATLVSARQLRTKMASEVGQIKSARSLIVQDLTKIETVLKDSPNSTEVQQ